MGIRLHRPRTEPGARADQAGPGQPDGRIHPDGRRARVWGLRRRRRPPAPPAGPVEGTARLDRRTKRLVERLKPGNVAIIDHDDLDLLAAEALADRGVAAVVNARRSISGRYPNLGPLFLVRAGIPVLDDVGQEVFERVVEGMRVRLEGSRLVAEGRVVAEGTRLTEEGVLQAMDAARRRLSQTVEGFAENTLEFIRREQDVLVDGVRFPPLQTSFKGRHALVVTRGPHYREDLRALRAYVREQRPVVVAVDGAADACLAEGIRPHVIFGDMDSVSNEALRCGAELVVHPPGQWRRRVAAGLDCEEPECVRRIRLLGLRCHLVSAPGTSEDLALLLAHERGAELVVAVGSHLSVAEFLDKGRQGMASTFLARLRVGANLVDAKGVSQLYRTRVRLRELLALVVAAAFTMFVIVLVVSRPARLYGISTWELITQLLFRLKSWL